jgi:hypothetical protein
MARQRDYRAEYRARVQRAKARGLTVAQATGHARRSGQQSVTQLTAAGKLTALPRFGAKRPAFHTSIPAAVAAATGTSDVYQSTSASGLLRVLRQAAAAGQHVAIGATFQTDQGVRTQWIGASKQHHNLDATGRPIGKVSVSVGSDPSGAGRSIPAADIVAAIDGGEFDDLWDWLADAWDHDGIDGY